MDLLNARLCSALGVTDLETVVDVTLSIRHDEVPILTISRVVLNPERLESVAEMIGLTYTTASVTASNFTSH